MCHTLLQMDEPVRYAMILYTDTAVFLNITGSAAALTGIISSTVSYQKGASHRWRLALICFSHPPIPILWAIWSYLTPYIYIFTP